MKRIVASLLFSSVMLCGAQAFADDTATTSTSKTTTTLTNSHAVHKKLMKDCMDKAQSSGTATADARKSCQEQVKTQMAQMNNAGTLPPSSVPQKSGESSSDSSNQSSSESNQSSSYGH
ncbi:MAG TPA: hypothetical protein VIX87_02130 [Steroidobacteraceae bacterium]